MNFLKYLISIILVTILQNPVIYAQFNSPNQLTQSCSSDYDCLRYTGNSKCSSTGRCVCLLGFTSTTNRCVRKYCNNNFDCTASFYNTRCNSDRTCTCEYNAYVNQDTQTCVSSNGAQNPGYPGIPGYPPNGQYPPGYPGNNLPGYPPQVYRCTYDYDCTRILGTNGRCSGNQCSCAFGFQLIGNRCESARCSNAYDCTRPGTTCNSASGVCDCDSSHYFDYSTNTCVRRYGWNGSQGMGSGKGWILAFVIGFTFLMTFL